MQVQADPETAGRQTAVFAVCVHAFVTVKPERLNCYEKSSYGIGLYNINRRIKMAYGEEFFRNQNTLFRVSRRRYLRIFSTVSSTHFFLLSVAAQAMWGVISSFLLS